MHVGMDESVGRVSEASGKRQKDDFLLEEATAGSWFGPNRKKWRGIVMDRMRHLDKWEMSQSHAWQGVAMLRKEPQVPDVVFACRVCGFVCKSKGGLVNHRRRMHEESTTKKMFKCGDCERDFKKESDLLNHAKVCGVAVAAEVGKVKCVCGKQYAKSFFRRH